MNVNEMSDHEKSVILAKLCGWKVFRSGINGELDRVTVQAKEWTWTQFDSDKLNLYEPAAMAGAWLVLNYTWLRLEIGDGVVKWWFEKGRDLSHPYLPACGPADAQRLWLDKVLSLAIEAGMVATAVSEDGEK